MHYSAAIVALFAASMAPITSAGLTPEDIKEVVADGCVNNIKFSSSFKTNTGEACSTCTFFDGSLLSSFFDPKVENVCVDCGVADNSCTNLEIVAEFENSWLMNFIMLTSSAMPSDNDPFKIIIKASDDKNTWHTINESDLVFAERKKDNLVLFNNNLKYNIYSISFQRKNTSTKICLEQYGLVESYTKACAANLFGGITGVDLLPYKWTMLYGHGSLTSNDAKPELWLAIDEGSYIRRICDSCPTTSHKEIIYKRLTPKGDFDFEDLFLSNWFSKNSGAGTNIINKDFKLYSSVEDALKDQNAWEYCNYDHPKHVGFPDGCGPEKNVSGNWNSLINGNSVKDYAFYLLN